MAPEPLSSLAALASASWLAAVGLLLLATIAPLAGRGAARASSLLAVPAGLLITFFGIVALTGTATFEGAWGSVLHFTPLAVHYDGLSAAFVIALGVTATAASLSIAGAQPRTRFEAGAYPLFLLSMLVVLGARDAFSFLFAWESMALLSGLLVVGLHPSRGILAAGTLYLAMTHAATMGLLIAFGLLASSTGGQLEFAAWRESASSIPPLARDVVFVLAFIGFGTKAGTLPLHMWLPRAHPVAPSHISALMSGVMIKTGIYGLVRIVIDVLGGGPDWWGVLFLVAGSSSAVLGILYALMQHDLKRLLAFSSIENIGIILIALGSSLLLASHGLTALAALALAAALFHVLNHAVFKSLLFLGAGAVLHGAGIRDMNRLGGLAKSMPVTAITFGIAAAAISGVPPLNGFASEWLVFQGLLGAVQADAIPAPLRMLVAAVIGALALTSALAIAGFVKATGVTFLGLPRSHAAAAAHEARMPARLAVILLAATAIGLGLAAAPVGSSLTAAASTLLAPGATTATLPAIALGGRDGAAAYAPLVVAALLLAVGGIAAVGIRAKGSARRSITWTCGIEPEPAFQYNSTGFSKPLRLFFRRILMPERAVKTELHPGTPFPASMTYQGTVTLVLEARLFRPLHVISIRLARLARRIQGGALQLYLAYTVAAVIILILWARLQ